MSENLKRRDGEDFRSFHIRLYENLDTYEIDSKTASKILNEDYGSNYDESKWRKDYAQYVKWKDYIQNHNTGDAELDKLTIKKLELQKERNKLSAEKTELNKWIREQARTENIYDKIEDAIKKLKPIKVPTIVQRETNDEQQLIVDIADAHIGMKVDIRDFDDNVISEYNTEIFKKRMWELLERTIEIVKKENVSHVTVLNLGDFVDGLLHTSQLKFQELNVMDQVMFGAEFMAEWLNKLSEYVTIDYRSVTGNHAETRVLHSGRSEFREENVEVLVSWYIKSRLANNSRVKVYEIKPVIYFDILGTKVLAVHGQDEKNLESSLKDYQDIYNVKVHIMKSGHLHHINNKTITADGIRNVEYVQSPAIASFNDYAVNKKKTSVAGSLITLIKDGYGKVCTYDVRFK